jgi:beta-galactosidase GanA
VLDVVRGERVLDYLIFNMMHVRNFVEECIEKWMCYPEPLVHLNENMLQRKQWDIHHYREVK